MPTDDNLRADLIDEIGTVFEQDPCIVERRGCVSRRVEKASF